MADANELNTLDNEIKNENKLAIMDRYRANHLALNNNNSDEVKNYLKSATMHEQRANWLTELKEVKLKESNLEISILDELESELTSKDNISEHEIEEVFNSYYNYDLACHIFKQYVCATISRLRN